jgi:hyperosmotically inducible protein
MLAPRPLRVVALAMLATVLVATPSLAPARSVGQAIDDATIATSVKTRLVADAFSNLTKVNVKANEGVVTLSGEVDTPLRRDRAVQIAASADGVKSVVDELRVTGVTPTAHAPAPPPVPTATTTTTTSSGSSATDPHVPAASVERRTPAPPVQTRTPASSGATSSVTVPGTVDVNGIVAQVDTRARTITLRDGRVVKMADGTVIWQPVPITSVQPGAQVSLAERGAGGVPRTDGGEPW